LLSLALSQDCNNPLLEVFQLEALSDPEPGSEVPFCENLQNGETCCSVQTVQSFQERLNNLTASLQDIAGQRDVYMTELFSNYTHQFQRVNDDLSDFDDEVRRIQREDPLIGNAINAQFNFLQRLDDELDRIDDRFTGAFRDYQQKRQSCFITLLQVQTSAWCLACDPNYASLGVADDGSVNSSPDVCSSIQLDCAPFLLANDYLNPLFQAQQAFQRLNNLTSFLRDYKNNNNTLPDTRLIDDENLRTAPFERTSSVPDGCNETSCEWQCSNLFSPQFVLNETIAGNGAGEIGGQDVSFSPIPMWDNVLVASRLRNTRLLQQVSGIWAPNLEGTGLVYDVALDPGNADPLLPSNDNTDDTSDYVTDRTDDTDTEGTWTERTDRTDRTDFDTTDDRTDNSDSDRPRNLQFIREYRRTSDSSDTTDSDTTIDNITSDSTDSDSSDY